MPTLRRMRRRMKRPRRFNRKAGIYGTKPKFMPNRLALERAGNVSTKTFYFKAAGAIPSDPNGTTKTSWRTQYGPVVPDDPNRMPNISDAYTFAECYTEYKVLAIKVKLFAANVGSEVGGLPAPPPAPPTSITGGFSRGDTCIYFDQDVKDTEQQPDLITEVMTYGSAKMIPSRIAKWTTTLYRKKGLPEWGCCDRNVPIAERQPDPWYAGIYILGNNARPLQPPPILWYYTVSYKIIFRGRTFTP